jgi:uncharacterized protein (TIGR02246 family)
MRLRRLMVMAMLTALIGPAHAADEGMTVLQDFGSKWQTAYNDGDPGKVAGLYAPDAVFISGVLGSLRGNSEIEKAVANQMKQTPKITVSPMEAHQNGNVVWGSGDFVFPNGPSGHYGLTIVNAAGAWHIAMHISNVTPPKKQ